MIYLCFCTHKYFFFIADDCSEHGIAGSCTVYDNRLTIVHYASLPGKEVELEVVRSLMESNNKLAFSEGSEMTYIGPRILSRFYRLHLVGTPTGTILNPILRDYIATVTMDFLRSSSENVPHLMEVTGQELSRRLKDTELRGGRQLELGLVIAESYMYGLGDDTQSFFGTIESAFQNKEEAYRLKLQREQYRPSAINDGEDFGAIFKDLLRVHVRAKETSNTAGSEDDIDTAGVVIWSIILTLSLLFLIYRVVKDYFMEQDGHGINKGEKDSVQRQKQKDNVAAGDGTKRPMSHTRGHSNKGANEQRRNPSGECVPGNRKKKNKRSDGGAGGDIDHSPKPKLRPKKQNPRTTHGGRPLKLRPRPKNKVPKQN